MAAEVHVGLFARQQKQPVVRESGALVVEKFEQGQGLIRLAPVPAKAVVKLCQMNDINARLFDG